MKQTAVEWLVSELKKYDSAGLKDQSNYVIEMPTHILTELEEEAKEKENEQKGYSEEEFLEFSEWVSHNDWVYLPSKGYWVNEEQEESEQKFTTKQLFKKFKKQ